MFIRKRYIGFIALCLGLSLFVPAVFLPVFAQSDDTEDRLAALEERVTALEDQLAALLADREVPGDPSAEPFLVGEALGLTEGLTLTINSYETGSRFRYYPSGGFSTTTLTAKNGYRLLCLYVTVQNDTGADINVSTLMDMEVFHGSAYSSKVRDTFFYLTSRGVYAGGLRTIGQKTSVEGCLLFAIPEAAETSEERLAVQLRYHDKLYACTVRESGSLLPAEGESESF